MTKRTKRKAKAHGPDKDQGQSDPHRIRKAHNNSSSNPNKANECEEPEDEHANTNPQKVRTIMRWSDPSWLMFIVAGIGAVVSFATFLAICVQAWVYMGQLKEMEKSTQAATKAAKAAEDSVELARSSIEAANTASQFDQRAWVTVALVRFTKPLAIGDKISVQLTVHNSGKTPAVARMIGRIEGSTEPLSDAAFKDLLTTGHPSIMVLGPDGNGDGYLQSLEPLTADQSKALNSGALRLYVIGSIEYDDVFSHHHSTRFCFSVTGSEDVSLGILGAYKQGNSVD